MDDEAMFSLFDSLKREMEEMKQELRQELKQELRPIRDSVERIEARLSRQGGIIQGGARQVTRLVNWSEDVDQMLAERDERIEDLTRRVEKLEKGG
jgi:chromosome segregation ATPase